MQEPEPAGNGRRAAVAVAGVAGAALLLWLLHVSFGESFAGAAGKLRAVSPPAWGMLLLATSAQLAVAASKWRVVSEASLSSRPMFRGGYVFYTGLAFVLAQLLPPPFVSVFVRSLASRAHQSASLKRGAAIAVYDLVFDFLPAALLTLPAALFAASVLPASASIAASAAMLAAAWWGIHPIVRAVVRAMSAATAHAGALRGIHARLRAAEQAGDGVLRPQVSRRLFGLSVMRYAAMVACSCIVAWSTGSSPAATVALSYPLLCMAVVLSWTPAGLGIQEWSWIGILVAFGTDSAAAAEFALLNRAMMFVAVMAAGCAVLLWRWIALLRKPTAAEGQERDGA